MLSRFSLKSKLLLSFSFVSVVLFLVGALNYFSLHKVVKDYKHVAEINLPNSIYASELYHHIMEMKQASSLIGMPGLSPENKLKLNEEYRDSKKKFKEVRAIYEGIPFAEGEDVLWASFESSYENLEKTTDKIFSHVAADGFDYSIYTKMVLEDLSKESDDITLKYQALSDFHNKQEAPKMVARADETSAESILWSFALVGGGVVIALSFGWVLSHGLSSTLKELAAQLSKESDSVAGVAVNISSASNSLSSSTTEQAAALQETVASIEEVSAMVQKNADNSKRSQDKSSQCSAAVAKGKETVDQVISAISEISTSNNNIMNQVEDSNRQLADIVKVIKEIATKTTVINDIVFQTKLLSFNASVEAARAGEHGKGFAVVAQEVGNLAEMSGNAAKEISSMLEASVHKVETIVTETKNQVESLIQTGKSKVQVGTVTAQRCGEMLDEIVALVRDVNLMVTEISTASQEQSQGVSEINKAMTQMDQVTQMNASSAQYTASSANILSGQAANLKKMVEDLSHTVHGSKKVVHEIKEVKEVKSNIVSIQSHKVVKQAETRKPVVVKKVEVKKVTAPSKVAVGGDLMPSADDPRFEDV